MKLKIFKQHWPIFLLIFISFFLFLTNYVPGSFLLGWDNTVPELNLKLNLIRFLSAVWQEYRGLGTLDGMAHTANIMHWLYSALLSFIMPTGMIRYVINLLTHLAGGIGLFILVKTQILPLFQNKKKKLNTCTNNLIALTGALFYMFNFFTIQMYHMPLELFSFHFALLPWGIWSLIQVLKKGHKKDFLLLALINFLGVSQSHVPTIFINYLMVITPLLGFYLSTNHKNKLKKIFSVVLVIFCVNAFWGLPYTYSTLAKVGEIGQAKQNRLGTDSVFYRNNAWGDLKSILHFGNFRLDYYDWYQDREQFLPVMLNWVDWYQHSYYQIITAFLSMMIVIGFLISIFKVYKTKNWILTAFTCSWFFSFCMIGTQVPIIKYISIFLRNYLPLFHQIFRFIFTKFAFTYIFFASIFISVTLISILSIKKIRLINRLLKSTSILLIIAIFYTAYPSFTGNFFYSQLRIKLPDSYQKLTIYLNQNQQNKRLASFPIHSLWGWTTNTTDWGYRGSGFIWQMMAQPLLDRAFDPWSQANETAFLQLNQALYSKNEQNLIKTFKKYHINTIWLDKNVYHPGNYEEAIFRTETEDLLKNSSNLRLQKKFDQLELWDITNHSQNLELFLPDQLTLINDSYQSQYTKYDQAYLDYGNYLQVEQGINYPFSFLQKDNLKIDLTITENNQLIFKTQIPKNNQITIPLFHQEQKLTPTNFEIRKTADQYLLKINEYYPTVEIDNSIFQVPGIDQVPLSLEENETYYLVIDDKLIHFNTSQIDQQWLNIGTLYLENNRPNTISLIKSETKYSEKLNLDNALSCTEKNNCINLSFSLPSTDNFQLISITTDFLAQPFAKPDICLKNTDQTACLNPPIISNYSQETAQKKLTVLTPITKPSDNTYSLELISQSQNNKKNNIFINAEIQFFTASQEIELLTNSRLNLFEKKIKNYLEKNNKDNRQLKIIFNKDNDKNFFIKDNLTTTGANKPYDCSLLKTGQINKEIKDNKILYSAQNKSFVCDQYLFPELRTDIAYLFNMKGTHHSGMRMRVYLTNPITKHFELEDITSKGSFDDWYAIWPSNLNIHSNRLSNYYQLNLNGETYGAEKFSAELESLQFLPIPLGWLRKIKIAQEKTDYQEEYQANFITRHQINSFLYIAKIETQSDKSILVLPQSFEKGWIALNTKNLKQRFLKHFEYNGWANAWELKNGESQILIIYWPQFLSYLGYLILIIYVAILIRKK